MAGQRPGPSHSYVEIAHNACDHMSPQVLGLRRRGHKQPMSSAWVSHIAARALKGQYTLPKDSIKLKRQSSLWDEIAYDYIPVLSKAPET